jgi:hypothetical protein
MDGDWAIAALATVTPSIEQMTKVGRILSNSDI